MWSVNNISIAVALCLAALRLPHSECSPYFLQDDRVRDLDATPVLGRGFSIMTNTFAATCLQTEQSTTSSYNYDRK